MILPKLTVFPKFDTKFQKKFGKTDVANKLHLL